MTKRILTLDNLYEFFVQQNKNVSFSAKSNKGPIVVSVPGNFSEEENDMPGMLKLKLKVCHILENRNGSYISKENMEKAMPSLKYRPILAYIHDLEDGTKDFYAHNMEIVEDEDGESTINYIEKQVGCFTADDPWLEYDSDMDKTYVMAYSVIPEEYTDAADIIRRKNGTKVSCELCINRLEYNAKEKYLDLIDFYFGGCTLLGCDENGNEIGEGMLGSRADIADFCYKEPVFAYQDKLIEALEKLNVTLEGFNKQSKEGGEEEMDNFENEVEDEVVESEVEETVVETNETEVANEAETEETSASDDGEPIATEEEACGKKKKKKKCSVDENGNMSVSFEISHEDIRGALFNLLGIYEEEDNEWYWITNVYDDYFIFENWDGNKLYKQSYAIDGDNVALSGDRQEMFKMILTESEKLAIDKMREDYSELVKFKEDTETAKLQEKKDAVFTDTKYANIVNTKVFKKLIADSKDYAVEECVQKANDILDDFSSFTANFSTDGVAKKPQVLSFGIKPEGKKKVKAYGKLFDN